MQMRSARLPQNTQRSSTKSRSAGARSSARRTSRPIDAMSARRLKTLLGDYPVTEALKQGRVTTGALAYDFADVKVPHTAFKRVVRELEFDVAELSIVTYLLAKAHGKPFRLLPAVMFGRFQHPYLVSVSGLRPKALEGKKVAIRSSSVTTVAWLRGILADDYGVDLSRIR